MGYSITQEQHEKLERHRREGRLCAMSTRGGGCFCRATVRQRQESWTYRIGEGESKIHEMTLCRRHAMPVGSEGVNFRVLSTKRIAA